MKIYIHASAWSVELAKGVFIKNVPDISKACRDILNNDDHSEYIDELSGWIVFTSGLYNPQTHHLEGRVVNHQNLLLEMRLDVVPSQYIVSFSVDLNAKDRTHTELSISDSTNSALIQYLKNYFDAR